MKKALVTGASRGFGFLITKELLENDFLVYAGVRKPEKAELITNLAAQYKNLQVISLDVASSTEIDAALAKISSLDLLVNNAGYGLQGYLLDFDKEKIEEQLRVNTIAPVEIMSKSFLKLNKNALIINLSSIASYLGLPVGSAYAASKIALNYFSQSFAIENAKEKNLSIVNIEPGKHQTDFMNSAKSFGELESYFQEDFKSADDPKNVARLVLKLLRKKTKQKEKFPIYLEVPIGKGASLLKFACKFIPKIWTIQFIQRKLKSIREKSAC